MSAPSREGLPVDGAAAGAQPFWPRERLPEALREAILRSDLPTFEADVEPFRADDDPRLDERWLRKAARAMGLEGSPKKVRVAELSEALAEPGPYLVVLHAAGGPPCRAISLVRRRRGDCVLVRPDGREGRISLDALAVEVQRGTTAGSWVSSLFEGLPGGRAALARLLESAELGPPPVTVVRYELDAAHPLAAQLRSRGVTGRVLAYFSVTTLQAAVAVGAAWTLGDAALTGIIDVGRVAAWSMLAASDVPLQYVATSLLGGVSLDFAATVKKRLLEGTLFIEDGEVRRQGFGALLARLNEASVVEQTSVAELVGVLSPLAQLVAAAFLLGRGAVPQLLVSLLLAFAVAGGALLWTLRARYRAWYAARIRLTEDLVDKIVGHRTRTMQDNPARLHETEDADLDAYARLSARWDGASCAAATFGRVWLVVAGLVLLLAFVFGASVESLLMSAIATFLALRGFSGLLGAAGRLVVWLSAWEGVRPLFVAGRARARAPRRHAETEASGLDTVVSSLSFGYAHAARPILSNANLRIRTGERILVEGPSGGGKTTFSKLLTGDLRPTSGTILVEGVDVFSVSEAEWRRRITASPQFHENYVFSNTFAFNVDPRCFDGVISAEAMRICGELGLDPLLAKMPAGAAQLLGETGWQLSHGERSRVFIARALLQGAGLIVLDESFGALDAESLALSLDCVRRRARTLVVIAHT